MPQLEKTFQRLGQFVERYMQIHSVPGMAIVLTDREKLLHVATYGYADVERQRAVQPETLFEIGSISKSFTCMALLQLQDGGKLDIHAPVTTYLPWFTIQSPYAPITIHHLMSHTAGITSGVDPAPSSRYSVHLLHDTRPAYAPGEHFHYSNVAFQALGYVLEELEGKSYAEIIRERILDPLGMHATEPVITNQMRAKLAVGYNALYDDRPMILASPLVPATWLECGAGDGSISSTATDMTGYLRLLLNEGQTQQSPVLSHANYCLMTQRIIPLKEGRSYGHGLGRSYGYGLMLGEQDGYATVGHTGDMVGYRSIMLGDCEHGLGVIVLFNGPGDPTPIGRTALRFLRAAYRGEQLPEVPAVPAPTTVENALEYVGEYHGLGQILKLERDGKGLVLVYKDKPIVLERLNATSDLFYINHPDFALFPLQFVREEGVVVECTHGDQWYRHSEHAREFEVTYPLHWQHLTGHYRSYNPWFTNFRVVLRRGQLYVIDPGGSQELLTPLEENTFRVGDALLSPEYLRFDTFINEQAQRAIYSGGEFFRTFDP